MTTSKPPRQLNSRLTLVITRYLSRAHTIVYRITRGRFGGNLRVGAGFRKPAPTLLLEHRGRRSGKRFTSPLLYITDGPNVIIVASAAGRDDTPSGTATCSPTPTPTSRSEPTAAPSLRSRPTPTNGRVYGRYWCGSTPTSTPTRAGPSARSRSSFSSRANRRHNSPIGARPSDHARRRPSANLAEAHYEAALQLGQQCRQASRSAGRHGALGRINGCHDHVGACWDASIASGAAKQA